MTCIPQLAAAGTVGACARSPIVSVPPPRFPKVACVPGVPGTLDRTSPRRITPADPSRVTGEASARVAALPGVGPSELLAAQGTPAVGKPGNARPGELTRAPLPVQPPLQPDPVLPGAPPTA